MLRTHDVVLAEGTFRVVLTPRLRVVAAIDAPNTALGPIHVALEVDRSRYLPELADPATATHVTAGFFDDIGHAVEHAAEGTFDAASHVATTIARPAFDIVRGAASEGAHLLAQTTPFLPSQVRQGIDNAAHIIMRARLGDVTAKQFIQSVVRAAKAGVQGASHVADALLDASKVVAKTIDVPMMLASHVPILGNVVQALSPLAKFQTMVSAIQAGDFNKLKQMGEEDLSMMQSVASLIPGIGTGFSAALSAGLSILDGGGPLEIAIRAAYGAIPIPPGVRTLTDPIVDTVIAIATHPSGVTDAAIAIARQRVPAGIAREVFDTLVNLVAHRMPIQKAGAALLDHYVTQYAPLGAGLHVSDALEHAMRGLSPALQGLPAMQHALNGLGPAAAAAAMRPGARMVQPLHAYAH